MILSWTIIMLLTKGHYDFMFLLVVDLLMVFFIVPFNTLSLNLNIKSCIYCSYYDDMSYIFKNIFSIYNFYCDKLCSLGDYHQEYFHLLTFSSPFLWNIVTIYIYFARLSFILIGQSHMLLSPLHFLMNFLSLSALSYN